MNLRLLTCLVFLLGLGGLAGCDRNEGPAEELEEAGEEAGQAIEDTAEETGDALEDTGDEIEDAADEAN